MYERLSFTHKKIIDIILLYIQIFYAFEEETGKHETVNKMVASNLYL